MNELLSRHRKLGIAIDGAAVSGEIAKTVSLVLVRSVLGVPSVAEIDFAEPPASIGSAFSVGSDIRLELGRAPLFGGRIAAIAMEHGADAGRVFRIRAYDAMEQLRQRRQIRRIENTSARDVAQRLAGDVGLAAAADRAATSLNVATQRGESDLEFLAELAARDGLYPVVENDTLRLASLEGEGDEIELTLGENLTEARLSLSAERSLESAEAGAWSPTTLQTHPASDSRAAERGAGTTIIPDRLVEGAAESRSQAAAALARASAFERVAEGTCLGDPELRPGCPIRLRGVADPFAGRYGLTSVLHRLDAGGFRTEFSTRPPELRMRKRGTLVTLGRVVSISDPENRGRCKVSLPGFADVEASWLQVVIAGAGRRKGVAVLPEPDEDVLAVFPDGDLAHGFVLGGLYGTRALPSGLRGSADRPFVIRTGNGQTLELSGKGATARLSTRTGSLLEFTSDRARLAAASDLIIEAPGKRILIRADAVDFERG